jgi:hypothetical protein
MEGFHENEHGMDGGEGKTRSGEFYYKRSFL